MDFISTPGAQLIGWLVSVVSLPLAVYFYWKQRVAYDLTYDVCNKVILRPTNVGDVQVKADYAGHQASCLVQSIVIVRNSGNQSIKADEVVDGVQFGSRGTVLGGRILYQDSLTAEPSLHLHGLDYGVVRFGFLRPREGLIFSVLHADPDLGIDLRAEGHHFSSMKYKRVPLRSSYSVPIALGLAVLVGAGLALISKYLASPENFAESFGERRLLLGVAFSAALLGALYNAVTSPTRAELEFRSISNRDPS